MCNGNGVMENDLETWHGEKEDSGDENSAKVLFKQPSTTFVQGKT